MRGGAEASSSSVFVIPILCLCIIVLAYLLITSIKDCNSKLKEACPIVKPGFTRVEDDREPAKPIVASVPPLPQRDIVYERDVRVLRDDLYPPYNRSSTEITRDYATHPALRPLPTRDTSDTYRIVGYLVDQEDKNDVWKLYAREKHRGGRSEFYVSPANRNYDMKIFIDNDMVSGSEKLTDVYNLPNELRLKHPMMGNSTYQVVELPKSDFSSSYF